MPIDLQICDDLSLQDLLGFHQAGLPVFKTPHVGNFYPNNLAVASLGIPMKVVDHTCGRQDKNFHPHCVIVNGSAHRIAHEHVLTSHARVAYEPPHFADRFYKDATVAEAHMQAVRDAIPSACIETWSHHLNQRATDCLVILELLTKLAPEHWKRFVTEEGLVQSRSCRHGWFQIATEGIHGIHGERGWICPNVANILMDVMVDAHAYHADRVYHLSGPDMYRYIGKMLPELSRLYDLIRAKLDWRLPEVLPFILAPVADMTFAVSESQMHALDALIDAWLSLEGFEASIGARMQRAEDRRAEITRVQGERKGVQSRLRSCVRACPEVFYTITDGSYLSQYDLLLKDEDLYTHPWVIDQPIKTIRRMQKRMVSML